MLALFDEQTMYTLPNGESVIGSELMKRDSYNILKNSTCIVETFDNILYSVSPLGSFCQSYGVEYDEADKQKSFDEAMGLRKKRLDFKKENPVNPTTRLVTAAAKVAQITAMSFTDEQALEVKDIYPEYQVDHAYKQGDFFTHEGELYKVNQAHTSASQWEPGSVGTESLYTHLTLNEDGYPIWKQPTGAHDAYNKGDIVEYNGELYKSLIDGNAYSPDTYPAGWEKYTEPTE